MHGWIHLSEQGSRRASRSALAAIPVQFQHYLSPYILPHQQLPPVLPPLSLHLFSTVPPSARAQLALRRGRWTLSSTTTNPCTTSATPSIFLAVPLKRQVHVALQARDAVLSTWVQLMVLVVMDAVRILMKRTNRNVSQCTKANVYWQLRCVC